MRNAEIIKELNVFKLMRRKETKINCLIAYK